MTSKGKRKRHSVEEEKSYKKHHQLKENIELTTSDSNNSPKPTSFTFS
jgi:hypothetical protein